MMFTYSSQELDLIFPFSALSHGCEGACSDSGSRRWLPAVRRCWASQADISILLIHSHIGQPSPPPPPPLPLLPSLLAPTTPSLSPTQPPTHPSPPCAAPRRQQQCGFADGAQPSASEAVPMRAVPMQTVAAQLTVMLWVLRQWDAGPLGRQQKCLSGKLWMTVRARTHTSHFTLVKSPHAKFRPTQTLYPTSVQIWGNYTLFMLLYALIQIRCEYSKFYCTTFILVLTLPKYFFLPFCRILFINLGLATSGQWQWLNF